MDISEFEFEFNLDSKSSLESRVQSLSSRVQSLFQSLESQSTLDNYDQIDNTVATTTSTSDVTNYLLLLENNVFIFILFITSVILVQHECESNRIS